MDIFDIISWRIAILERADYFNIGSSPVIDVLIVIAHHTYRFCAVREKFNQLFLNFVYILILIDNYMFYSFCKEPTLLPVSLDNINKSMHYRGKVKIFFLFQKLAVSMIAF